MSPSTRTGAWRVIIWILVAMSCYLGTSRDPANAEPKKVTGTSEPLVLVARTSIFLASTLDTGLLESNSRGLVSQDPDWNHATVFAVSFTDPAMRQEHQKRGHAVITHPSGDQTFVEYTIMLKELGGGDLDWKVLGHFVRGTGKFKGITGVLRERGRLRSTGMLIDWEAEYNLP